MALYYSRARRHVTNYVLFIFSFVSYFKIDACEPGSSSSDGIVPCSLCEVGYYQNLYGQTNCVRCPGAMSTLSIGSTDIANCYGKYVCACIRAYVCDGFLLHSKARSHENRINLSRENVHPLHLSSF